MLLLAAFRNPFVTAFLSTNLGLSLRTLSAFGKIRQNSKRLNRVQRKSLITFKANLKNLNKNYKQPHKNYILKGLCHQIRIT
jgi:hypothetical protein